MVKDKSLLPSHLQGKILKNHETCSFLLKNVDGELTHQVTVFDSFISIRPLPRPKHMIIIGLPDTSVEPDKNYDTDIYITDHAKLLVRGITKKDLEICLCSDEFSTKLVIDETEGKFER